MFRAMFYIVLAALAMIPTVVTGADGPRIEFEKLTHDYGQIRYGEKVTAEFAFTNKGNQTLVIKNLHATCGCTKVIEGSREIPPNGSSKIISSFETDGLKAGRKQKSIMVSTNDPVNPVVKLNLLADVIRDITIDPGTLGKKIDSQSEAVSFTVKVSNSSENTYNITGVKTEPGEPKATIQPEKITVGPHKEVPFQINLKLEPEPNRSYYSGKVDLLTDHPKETDYEVRYLVQTEKAK
ncbi:MAG: DUF1573 domain-containing protein [Syntrophaceae bacterium]|nr:DUF1573 domain-containing protein [Syntrophaceae bacterium]